MTARAARTASLLALVLACSPAPRMTPALRSTAPQRVCDELAGVLAELLHVHSAEERVSRLTAACLEHAWSADVLACVRTHSEDVGECLDEDQLIDAMGESGMFSGEVFCDDATDASGHEWAPVTTMPHGTPAEVADWHYVNQLRGRAAKRACIVGRWSPSIKACVQGASARTVADCRARLTESQEQLLAAELRNVDVLWNAIVMLKAFPEQLTCAQAARASGARSHPDFEELCSSVIDGRPLLDLNDRACIISDGGRACRTLALAP